MMYMTILITTLAFISIININIETLLEMHTCHALKMLDAWQWPHTVILRINPNMMHSGMNQKVQ